LRDAKSQQRHACPDEIYSATQGDNDVSFGWFNNVILISLWWRKTIND